MDCPAQGRAVAGVDALPAGSLFFPGPQKRGTAGTLNWIAPRHGATRRKSAMGSLPVDPTLTARSRAM